MKLSRTTWAILKYLVLTAGCFSLLLFSYISFMFNDCGYEEQLQTYKDLPEARLSSLYTQMNEVFSENTTSLSKADVEKFYPELADLPFKHVSPRFQWVVIGGCFDDKLIMTFGGFSLSVDKSHSISINWSEHPSESQLLWQE